MITSDQEHWILSKAYVPEHIVSLMTIVSKENPFPQRVPLLLMQFLGILVVNYMLLFTIIKIIYNNADLIIQRRSSCNIPKLLWSTLKVLTTLAL